MNLDIWEEREKPREEKMDVDSARVRVPGAEEAM
jgi:hypothetical protein